MRRETPELERATRTEAQAQGDDQVTPYTDRRNAGHYDDKPTTPTKKPAAKVNPKPATKSTGTRKPN